MSNGEGGPHGDGEAYGVDFARRIDRDYDVSTGADRNLLQPVDTPFGGHHACYVSAT